MVKIKNNSNRLRLLIDLDGICVDLYSRMIEWYNRDFNDNKTKEDLVHWELVKSFPRADRSQIRSYFHVPGFWEGLDPIPGCKESLARLHEAGHDLIIVTACPSDAKQAYMGKAAWVEEHLPFIGFKNMISAKRKDVVAGDILFDDSPHNLVEYKGLTCTIDYPYNRRVYTNFRVSTWEGFEKIVKGLKI